MTLGVLSKQLSGNVEMSVLADASEHVEDFAAVRFGILHAVSRDEGQAIGAGKVDQLAINLFLAPNKMPLNFHENIFATEDVNQVGAIALNRPICYGGRRLACI